VVRVCGKLKKKTNQMKLKIRLYQTWLHEDHTQPPTHREDGMARL